MELQIAKLCFQKPKMKILRLRAHAYAQGMRIGLSIGAASSFFKDLFYTCWCLKTIKPIVPICNSQVTFSASDSKQNMASEYQMLDKVQQAEKCLQCFFVSELPYKCSTTKNSSKFQSFVFIILDTFGSVGIKKHINSWSGSSIWKVLSIWKHFVSILKILIFQYFFASDMPYKCNKTKNSLKFQNICVLFSWTFGSVGTTKHSNSWSGSSIW